MMFRYECNLVEIASTSPQYIRYKMPHSETDTEMVHQSSGSETGLE